MLTYTLTDGGVTAVIDGRAYTVARDNPVYGQVKQALIDREEDETIADLFRTADAVKKYTDGEVEVTDGELFYNGEPVHNVVVDKIFTFMTEGLPFAPLMAFLNRLLANPSKRSVQELYKFLEHKNLPITEDGYFLAYKGVTTDYKDLHTGKFDNHPGVTNSMDREKVDANYRAGCSVGFHVGSLEYATGFGPKTVIVRVDPKHVVSVPEDSDWQKLRTCKYKVLCDYQGPLPRPLHTDEPYEDEIVFDVESGYMDF